MDSCISFLHKSDRAACGAGVGAPAFQAGDKFEMTLGFSPGVWKSGVWKLGHLLCKYQIIAKQWPFTNRSSPMNMRVRRRFRPLWDCLAMGALI